MLTASCGPPGRQGPRLHRQAVRLTAAPTPGREPLDAAAPARMQDLQARLHPPLFKCSERSPAPSRSKPHHTTPHEPRRARRWRATLRRIRQGKLDAMIETSKPRGFGQPPDERDPTGTWGSHAERRPRDARSRDGEVMIRWSAAGRGRQLSRPSGWRRPRSRPATAVLFESAGRRVNAIAAGACRGPTEPAGASRSSASTAPRASRWRSARARRRIRPGWRHGTVPGLLAGGQHRGAKLLAARARRAEAASREPPHRPMVYWDPFSQRAKPGAGTRRFRPLRSRCRERPPAQYSAGPGARSHAAAGVRGRWAADGTRTATTAAGTGRGWRDARLRWLERLRRSTAPCADAPPRREGRIAHAAVPHRYTDRGRSVDVSPRRGEIRTRGAQHCAGRRLEARRRSARLDRARRPAPRPGRRTAALHGRRASARLPDEERGGAWGAARSAAHETT